MRHLGRRAAAAAILAGVLAGCGGGSIKEGMPKNIDMSKNYMPAAKPFAFSPADYKKADAKGKAAAVAAEATPKK
jgi:hypothetical protein